MNIEEALKVCEEGNFISNRYFDENQSMHYYNGEFYYEDGGVIGRHMPWLIKQDWAKTGWRIKINKDCVDFNKLDTLHKKYKNTIMNSGESYEECKITV